MQIRKLCLTQEKKMFIKNAEKMQNRFPGQEDIECAILCEVRTIS